MIRCFEPSQLQRITPGLREAFIKKPTVERAIKTEIDTRTEQRGVGELGFA